MDRIMLEVVVAGCVTTPHDILHFVKCTLLSAAHSSPSATTAGSSEGWQKCVADVCRQSLQNLGQQNFLEWAPATEPGAAGSFRALPLGRAAVAAGLQPEDALMMNEDVHMLARAVNLESDLHLMFLVAPVTANTSLDWGHVSAVLKESHRKRAVVRTVCQLSEIQLKIAERQAARQKRGWQPEVCVFAWAS